MDPAHSQGKAQLRVELAESLKLAGQLPAGSSPFAQKADNSGNSDWWLEGQLVARPPTGTYTLDLKALDPRLVPHPQDSYPPHSIYIYC